MLTALIEKTFFRSDSLTAAYSSYFAAERTAIPERGNRSFCFSGIFHRKNKVKMLDSKSRKLRFFISHISRNRVKNKVSVTEFPKKRKFCSRPVLKGSGITPLTAEILLYKAPLGQHKRKSAVNNASAANRATRPRT